MPDQKITDLVDGSPLQPTDEFVVARAGDNFKIDGADIVSVAAAAVTKHDVTLSGNTAGVLALVSSGTLSLAGGNNITLSQVGNAVTISGANAGGAQTGISGISASDTLYTSGTVRITGVGGGVTVSSNTGQRIDISVAAPVSQSVQPETQTFIGGISASNTLYTSGSVRISGSQAATVRSGTGQLVIIDVPAQSTQVETQTFIAGVSASDTLYTSGNVRITGVGGGITVSSNTGQRIDLSVAAQSVQPETQTFIAGVSASDTLYTSGNVRITGVGGGVTVSSNTGQRVDISVAAPVAQTVQTQNVVDVTLSGNTAGALALVSSGTLTLAGGNNITLSQAGNAVTISGAAAGAGQFSGGVSTGGNTAGATGITGTQNVFVGSNNITLSQTTGANGATISIIGGAGGGFSGGMSTEGNTAGSTGVTGTRLVFVGSQGVSLSQSTGAAGGTLSILAPATSSLSATGGVSISTNGATISIGVPLAGTISMWPAQPPVTSHVPLTSPNFSTGATRTTLTATVFPMAVDQHVSFNLARGLWNMSITSASTTANWSWTLGHSVGIYSLTGNSLSLLSSFSNRNRVSYTSTNNSTNATASWIMEYGSGNAFSGSRTLSTANAGVTGFWSSISSIKWHPYQTGTNQIPVGQYFLGYAFSSASAGANLARMEGMVVVSALNQNNHDIGANVVSTSAQWPLAGAITLTQTNTGMPASMATADITQVTNVGSYAQRSLYFNFLSQFYT